MEEVRYRLDIKKQYKDKNIKFAEEGRRYRPREKKRIRRVFILGGIAALAAATAIVTIIASGNTGRAALSDNVQAALQAPVVAALSFDAPASAPSIPASTPEVSLAAEATPPPSAPPKAYSPPAVAPLIYENDGNIYLACGEKRISLGEHSELYGCYESMNAMLSGDNRWLYYISGLNSAAGTGTLMKAPADASAEPVAVAERVCAVSVSYDGSKVMYFKDIQGVSGSLYLSEGGGEQLIADNAIPDAFELSPGGECISYFTLENDGTFALFIKKQGEVPAFVTYVEAEAVVDNGVNLTRVGEVFPFDSGDLLFSIEEDYNTPLYLFAGGSVKEICEGGYVIKVFASGGFLYGETGQETKPLWYKAPGLEPGSISENYDYIVFPDGTTGSEEFLFVERIGGGADKSGVMIYMISGDKIKSVISLADSEVVKVNKDLDCVAYVRDGALYASRKTDGGWEETLLSDVSAQDFSGAAESGMHVQFDETGETLYFCDEFKNGPLYRFSAKDGSLKKLVSKVDWFRMAGDTPFAHTTDDKLYRFTDGMQMICKGARELVAAQDGAYALKDGSVLFIDGNTGKTRAAGSLSGNITLSGAINYDPPLGEDAGKALGVLAREANYCLYKLGLFRDKYEKPLEEGQALSLTEKLLTLGGLGDDMSSMLRQYNDGFKAYVQWTNGNEKRQTAGRILEKALGLYENYLDSGENGEG